MVELREGDEVMGGEQNCLGMRVLHVPFQMAGETMGRNAPVEVLITKSVKSAALSIQSSLHLTRSKSKISN